MSEVHKLVLLPRFTTFAGTGVFRTAPINVRDYCRADLTAWRTAFVGTGVDFSLWIEESVDLTTWTLNGSYLGPPEADEDTLAYDLELPWIRVKADLSGTGSSGPMVTCWLVGNFVVRDR